jgi:hypothetical protein
MKKKGKASDIGEILLIIIAFIIFYIIGDYSGLFTWLNRIENQYFPNSHFLFFVVFIFTFGLLTILPLILYYKLFAGKKFKKWFWGSSVFSPYFYEYQDEKGELNHELVELIGDEDYKQYLKEKEESINDEDKVVNYALGFGWGKFWIISSYIGGTILLFVFLGIDLIDEFLPNDFLVFYGLLSLLFGLLGISSAWTLQKRKIIAYKLVYTVLVFNIVVAIIGILIDETIIDRVKDVIMIGISYCWYLYFKKRKRMFINA